MLDFINYWIVIALCCMSFISGMSILHSGLFKKFRMQHPTGYIDLGVCLMFIGTMLAGVMTLQRYVGYE